MNLLAVLEKAAGIPADMLDRILNVAKAADSDLAPAIEAIQAKLTEGLSADKILDMATVGWGEIKAIGAGKLDPHNHPSDAA